MLSTSWFFGPIQDEVRRVRALCNEKDAPEDEKSLHLLLWEDGQAIACGSLFFDRRAYRIARVCVVPEKRGQGAGDLVMRVLLMRAFNMMAERVLCRVTSDNEIFITRYGFCKTDHNEWEVTPDTLIFSSGCGHDCSSCALKSCHS